MKLIFVNHGEFKLKMINLKLNLQFLEFSSSSYFLLGFRLTSFENLISSN